MPTCPHCFHHVRQIKFGRNRTKSQRFKCIDCGRIYTPNRTRKYSAKLLTKAVEMFKYHGLMIGEISANLGLSRQLVRYWIVKDEKAKRADKI